MKKVTIALACLILLSIIMSIYYYPIMPDEMATHWNMQGKVDGYMPKFFGLFLFPMLLIFISALFLLIPKMDPLKKNIDTFEKYYHMLILFISLFFIIIQMMVISWNKGYEIPIGITMSFLIGALFFYVGFFLKKTKRNWFIGIRTPWTMNNDLIWEKTHNLGGNLYMLAGVIAIFGIFFEKYAIYFIIMPIILSTIITIIYSYVQYKKKR